MAKNLKDTQKELDKAKYLESEKQGKDLSGTLDYCNYCGSQYEDNTCYADQEEREKYSICAKAYKKFNKEKKNG